MKTVLKIALTSVIAITAATSALAQAGGADNCRMYAIASAKQAQEAAEKKCPGLTWSTDVKEHMAWCESQPAPVWRAALTERQAQLKSCTG